MPDISKDSVVYIKSPDSRRVETGFESTNEIEDYIQENFDFDNPTEIKYGVFTDAEKLSSVTVEPPQPRLPLHTPESKKHLKTVREQAQFDDRVTEFWTPHDSRKVRASKYCNNITYESNEVDFGISLDTELFESVPVSPLNIQVESEVQRLFTDIVGTECTYMGFESSYASRGRRNPFVRVYGRVSRDIPEERHLQEIMNSSDMLGIYHSHKNISPVPIELNSNYPNMNPYDVHTYIMVTSVTETTDSLETIADPVLEKVDSIRSKIESHGFTVYWAGKISFKKSSYDNICLGISYTE